MDLTATMRDEVAELEPELVELRRRLHRQPEVGLNLPRTQATLLEALDHVGLETTLGSGLSSVTAVLRGGGSGRTVLLRADMDALPVQEQTGLDFSSEVDGVMHACGHDLHVAMLVGGAQLLAAHRDKLQGDVVFMFQPGEEGWDGASVMIEEGVLSAAGPVVDAAYGMHVQSGTTPNNVWTTRRGTMMASSSKLIVTVLGRGGHGSTPHLGRDPVAAAAEMIMSLQAMVTRRFDVFDPVVLTVGTIHGGTASNVIPDTVEFRATIRSFTASTHAHVGDLAVQVCQGVARAHGLEVDATHVPEYPATVNDPAHADFIAAVAVDVFGEDRYQPMVSPQPGSEDFSRVLHEVPGSYVMLGASLADDVSQAPSNHSPRATFDDSVVATGALMHAELAVRSLAGLPPTGTR